MKQIGKLYFRYGTMGSAKTAMLLTNAYNFEERGLPISASSLPPIRVRRATLSGAVSA